MNYGKRGTSKKQKSMNSKAPKIGKKACALFIKAFFVCLLAAGVAGMCAGIGVVKGVIDNAPGIDSTSVIPTGYKSVMLDSEGGQMTELVAAGSNRIWVDIENVPQHVQDAFVAIEDERFYEHNGIDLRGIIRAGVRGVASGFKRTEGASTITQQLLKNSVFDFMSESTTAEKVERKLQEQFLAVELEKNMTKEEILEAYLNTINLGQNSLGVQAAANRYFNKDVKDLTISEAAVIAGITKSPTGYNPISNQEKNRERQELVLQYMRDQGYITSSEYEEAITDDVYARIQTTNQTKSETEVFSYYVDATIEQVLNDLQEVKGYTSQQAYNLVYYGGLTIETAQDPEIQAIMDEELGNEENYPPNVRIGLDYALTVVKPDGEQVNHSKEMMEAYFKKNESSSFELLFDTEEEAQSYIDAYKAAVVEEGDTVYERAEMTIQPQASMVVMDQATGYVKGIVGGRGEKTANLTLNRAIDTVRQPGSTFKVVAAYAAALDSAGMSLATTQYDAPYNYEGGRPVRNWNGEAYQGWTSLRKGIEQSMNIVAVKTLTDITPALGITYLENMGITTLQKETVNGNNDYTQAMALGGLTRGVTNLELTAAYATIANGGVYTKPVFYTRILDRDGNVLIDNSVSYTRTVLKDSTAWLLTSAMKDVVNQGTGGAVRFSGMTIAGKTGTTSKNNDVWFVGYTPYYTAGIWGGFDNNHKLGKGETSYHKLIWKNVMSRIHENLENKDFPKPDSVTSATVCAASGKLPIPGVCGAIKSEYFAAGSTPTEYCNVHVAGEVCIESGGLATDACPLHEYRIITLVPENNDVSGSPLVAMPCPLHFGNLIGGIVQPNSVDGMMPGDIGDQPEGEIPQEAGAPEGEIAMPQ
ncbi:MAG: PBP1A family penicillin-binding protein [Lachnospiraceae bacterium]|jgi:penicillin-binding protein 1A|nr:PBP1A family penicillin-binding protein [Lachnospiraceae bacterium]